jgi:hypothetical protein
LRSPLRTTMKFGISPPTPCAREIALVLHHRRQTSSGSVKKAVEIARSTRRLDQPTPHPPGLLPIDRAPTAAARRAPVENEPAPLGGIDDDSGPRARSTPTPGRSKDAGIAEADRTCFRPARSPANRRTTCSPWRPGPASRTGRPCGVAPRLRRIARRPNPASSVEGDPSIRRGKAWRANTFAAGSPPRRTSAARYPPPPCTIGEIPGRMASLVYAQPNGRRRRAAASSEPRGLWQARRRPEPVGEATTTTRRRGSRHGFPVRQVLIRQQRKRSARRQRHRHVAGGRLIRSDPGRNPSGWVGGCRSRSWRYASRRRRHQPKLQLAALFDVPQRSNGRFAHPPKRAARSVTPTAPRPGR